MMVACSSVDIEKFNSENSRIEVTTEDTSTPKATESTSETKATGTDIETTEDSEFYYLELEENKEEKNDFGSDGQMDMLCLERTKDYNYNLKINDQIIELITDNDPNYEVYLRSITTLYVHNSSGDYVFANYTGWLCFWGDFIWLEK